MAKIERRAVLAGLAAAPLAMPGLLRAQGARPVQIGLLSDMSGPFRDVGGPGNRVAAELAVQDFGGSVLDRPIRVRQATARTARMSRPGWRGNGSTTSASTCWWTAPPAPPAWRSSRSAGRRSGST